MKKFKFILPVLVIVLLMGGVALADNIFYGDTTIYQSGESEDVTLGAFPGGDIYQPMNVFDTLRGKTFTEAIAQTVATSTVTLRDVDSGKTYILSATGTNIILPVVGFAGVNFRFQVGGAMTIENMKIKSAEGDNIEGTLMVAGAVVDCAAEDQINFVVDGENIGDYFEIMSDGTQWLLGDSGVLTAAKLTCTDPA